MRVLQTVYTVCWSFLGALARHFLRPCSFPQSKKHLHRVNYARIFSQSENPNLTKTVALSHLKLTREECKEVLSSTVFAPCVATE